MATVVVAVAALAQVARGAGGGGSGGPGTSASLPGPQRPAPTTPGALGPAAANKGPVDGGAGRGPGVAGGKKGGGGGGGGAAGGMGKAGLQWESATRALDRTDTSNSSQAETSTAQPASHVPHGSARRDCIVMDLVHLFL